MRNIESFGAIKFYGNLIPRVLNDKHSWRKVSNILGTTRRILHPPACVHPDNARKSAVEYAKQSIKDCVMPAPVKSALKDGMSREFGIEF